MAFIYFLFGNMSDIPATAEDWVRSEDYQNSFLLSKDDVLDAVLKNSAEKGLRDIAVSPNQGKFLNLIVKTLGVKRVLEVGTLGGSVSQYNRETTLQDSFCTLLI